MKCQEEATKSSCKSLLSSTWWTTKVAVREDKDSKLVNSQSKNRMIDSRYRQDHLRIRIIRTTNQCAQSIIQTPPTFTETTKVLWAPDKTKTLVTLSKFTKTLQILKKSIIKPLLSVLTRIQLIPTSRSGLIKALPASLNKMLLFMMKHTSYTPQKTMCSLEVKVHHLLAMGIKEEDINWAEEMIRLILKL